LERGQIFHDLAILYKRSIIELQLQIFISLHKSDDYDDGRGLRMICSNGWNEPISFSSAMQHWRSCHLHVSTPHVRTNYEEGCVSIKKVQKAYVEKTIDNLYGTISEVLHFRPGENYPIKIIRFPHNEDTLALLSFLDHYEIPFSVLNDYPLLSCLRHEKSEQIDHSIATNAKVSSDT